jgi:hypothetical protein
MAKIACSQLTLTFFFSLFPLFPFTLQRSRHLLQVRTDRYVPSLYSAYLNLRSGSPVHSLTCFFFAFFFHSLSLSPTTTGERLSPYVALACIAMGFRILLG